jgi:hypothetical protein
LAVSLSEKSVQTVPLRCLPSPSMTRLVYGSENGRSHRKKFSKLSARCSNGYLDFARVGGFHMQAEPLSLFKLDASSQG